MTKKYYGFATRSREIEKGVFFKRTKKEEVFCRIHVGGVNSFADAQEILCDEMDKHKISVAILLPYYKKEEGNWVIG